MHANIFLIYNTLRMTGNTKAACGRWRGFEWGVGHATTVVLTAGCRFGSPPPPSGSWGGMVLLVPVDERAEKIEEVFFWWFWGGVLAEKKRTYKSLIYMGERGGVGDLPICFAALTFASRRQACLVNTFFFFFLGGGIYMEDDEVKYTCCMGVGLAWVWVWLMNWNHGRPVPLGGHAMMGGLCKDGPHASSLSVINWPLKWGRITMIKFRVKGLHPYMSEWWSTDLCPYYNGDATLAQRYQKLIRPKKNPTQPDPIYCSGFSQYFFSSGFLTWILNKSATGQTFVLIELYLKQSSIGCTTIDFFFFLVLAI